MGSSPLSFTRHGLEADYRRRSDLRFFVFDPTDAQDVIDFWNLRQFDRDVIPIHIEWFEQCVPMMREAIEQNHRPIPGNPFGTKFYTTLEFARSIPTERVRPLLQTHLRDLPDGSVHIGGYATFCALRRLPSREPDRPAQAAASRQRPVCRPLRRRVRFNGVRS